MAKVTSCVHCNMANSSSSHWTLSLLQEKNWHSPSEEKVFVRCCSILEFEILVLLYKCCAVHVGRWSEYIKKCTVRPLFKFSDEWHRTRNRLLINNWLLYHKPKSFQKQSFTPLFPKLWAEKVDSSMLFRLDAWALSVITTATWLAGWLSHSGIVSKPLNLSENFFDHLKAPSF